MAEPLSQQTLELTIRKETMTRTTTSLPFATESFCQEAVCFPGVIPQRFRTPQVQNTISCKQTSIVGGRGSTNVARTGMSQL